MKRLPATCIVGDIDTQTGYTSHPMPTTLRPSLLCPPLLLWLWILGVTFPLVWASSSHASPVRQTYLPADFAQFAPRSALDLVSQVPGFSIEEGGGDRGFGQADTNVLINGRRVSGKSNGPIQALERLSADSVERLEILDGASLDIGGMSGQVVNVVTVNDKSLSGRYRYVPRVRPTGENSEERFREFDIAVTGGDRNSEWTLSIGNEQRAFGDYGDERVTDALGSILDRRYEKSLREFDRPNISGSYSRETPSGTLLNVVGEVNGYYSKARETSDRARGTVDANTRVLKQSEDEYNVEIGADVEFDLSGGRLKLMGLHRFESSPSKDRTTTTYNDGVIEGFLFTRQADEAESIARAEFAFNAVDSQWRWSVEGTHNSLDIESQFDELTAEGEVIPVEFDGADARVEELRLESTLNVSKRLSETMTLQATLGAEYSEIKQTGSSALTRDFVRPKGFLALNYKPSDTRFLSVKLERAVEQLSFFDFIASVDVNQDRENVTNVDLVPPQLWRLEMEVQQSLGDVGSLTWWLFYEDVEDIVDGIPIEGGGQAPGNIDSATFYGSFLEATLLSDAHLWAGGRLDLALGYVNSEVIDPITGKTRKVSDEFYTSYGIDLRQDFAGTPWAIGASMSYEEDTPSVRIDEISLTKQTPEKVNFYVEHKDVKGLTIRANIWNLLGTQNRFSRTVFADRQSNTVLFSETRNRRFGYSYTLTIEGTF